MLEGLIVCLRRQLCELKHDLEALLHSKRDIEKHVGIVLEHEKLLGPVATVAVAKVEVIAREHG